MGYDIIGISRSNRVQGRHSDEACDLENHYLVGRRRRFSEGRKPGCYVANGRTYGFCLSYGAYSTWFDNLSEILWGVSAAEVDQHRSRYRGQRFFELITLPEGNDVTVGPNTSAKLYQDFVGNADKVKRGFQRIALQAKPVPRSKRRGAMRSSLKAASNLAKALGGTLVGGDGDPTALGWEWKWQVYRDFRRALKLASDDGLLIVAM